MKHWVGGRLGVWSGPRAWSPLGVPNNGGLLRFMTTIEGAAGQDVLVTLDQSVAISGLLLGPGDELATARGMTLVLEDPGTVALASIDGQLRIAGAGSRLAAKGIVAIEGTGRIELSDPSASIGANAPGAFLATFEGVTLVGGGQVGDDSLILLNGGAIVVDAPMTIDPPGGSKVGFHNIDSGLIHVRAPVGHLTIAAGTVESRGVIRIDHGAELTLTTPIFATGGALMLDGLVTAADPESAAMPLLGMSEMHLSGSGVMAVRMVGGVDIDPGYSLASHRWSEVAPARTPDPIGTLTIADFAGVPENRYHFDVRSVDDADHDRIASTGSVVFESGTVVIRMIDGCRPSAGDQLDLVDVAGVIVNPPTHIESCFAAELQVTDTIAGSTLGVRFLAGNGVRCDIDQDGVVGAVDLAALLGAWGSTDVCEASDLSGDGVVDASDIALLVGSWSIG
jgi:hypothetical protein